MLLICSVYWEKAVDDSSRLVVFIQGMKNGCTRMLIYPIRCDVFIDCLLLLQFTVFSILSINHKMNKSDETEHGIFVSKTSFCLHSFVICYLSVSAVNFNCRRNRQSFMFG